jgi:hypothetical protein
MTERPTYQKSTCCIPGCPRWSRKFPPGEEWICARHWRAMPRRCRRALLKVWQRLRDLYSVYEGRTNWTPLLAHRYDQAERLSGRLWDHGKRRVILGEAGL